MLLIVFFYGFARYLVLFYMVTGSFGSTGGLPIDLFPYRLTAHQIMEVRQGVPFKAYGQTVIDPVRDAICQSEVEGLRFVEIVPASGASYREVVRMIDRVQLAHSDGCALTLIVALASERS